MDITADVLNLLPLQSGAHLAQFRTTNVAEMHRAIRVYSHQWLHIQDHPRTLVMSFQGVGSIDEINADRIRRAVMMAGCTIVGVWGGSEHASELSSWWAVPMLQAEPKAEPKLAPAASVIYPARLPSLQVISEQPHIFADNTPSVVQTNPAPVTLKPRVRLTVDELQGNPAQAIKEALEILDTPVVPKFLNKEPAASNAPPATSSASSTEDFSWEESHANLLREIDDRMSEIEEASASPLVRVGLLTTEVSAPSLLEHALPWHAPISDSAATTDERDFFDASCVWDAVLSDARASEEALPQAASANGVNSVFAAETTSIAPSPPIQIVADEIVVPPVASDLPPVQSPVPDVVPISAAIKEPEAVVSTPPLAPDDAEETVAARLLRLARDMVQTIVESGGDASEGHVAINNADAPVSATTPLTFIYEQRVRSGMQIMAPPGQSLVAEGGVSGTGELISEESIHVYGAFCGRAFAGVTGNRKACIYTQHFEPELISIAGFYKLFEEVPKEFRGRPAKVWLSDDDKLLVRLLGA
jgi:septum formation inhibitor MinC